MSRQRSGRFQSVPPAPPAFKTDAQFAGLLEVAINVTPLTVVVTDAPLSVALVKSNVAASNGLQSNSKQPLPSE
ncbi:MAG: hypothetical protein R3F38_08270 [Gammaproteobacteria bacterium]